MFLINAGMDCLCFVLTARFLRRRLSRVRLAVASVLGGIYAVLALFIEVGQGVAFLIDVAVCLLLCLLVFPPATSRAGRAGRQSVLAAGGVYLLISFLLGGVMTGAYTLLNRLGWGDLLSSADRDGPTAWLFLLLALCGGAFTAWGGRLFHRKQAARTTATVEITMGRECVSLEGLVDSGNLLTDPVSGRPVLPVDKGAVRPLLSPALYAVLVREDVTAHPDALAATPETTRLRLVPAATATGRGLMVALRPDRLVVTLHTPGGDRACLPDALIALVDLPDDGPEALVPEDL